VSRRSKRSGRTELIETTDPTQVAARPLGGGVDEDHASDDRRSLLRDGTSLEEETSTTRLVGPSVSALERLLADKLEVQLLIRTYFATVHCELARQERCLCP
jgi:hypothetical protein